MSHFSVLVVVENPDKLEEVLLPYHEFECTGIEAHIQEVDDTKHLAEQFVEYGEGESFRDFVKDYTGKNEVIENEDLDIESEHKYGYTVINKAGEVVKVVDRTNPDAKWDWWSIGGRYSGRLLNFDFTKVDYACACDVNWEQMVKNSVKAMTDYYDLWHNKFNSIEVEEGRETAYEEWSGRNDEVKQVLPTYSDYYKASIAFHAVGDMLDLREAKKLLFMSREEYGQLGNKAPVYAFIDDNGNWNQRGEMGWFGMDDPDLATENYDLLFWEMVERLKDTEKQVFVIDCHI